MLHDEILNILLNTDKNIFILNLLLFFLFLLDWRERNNIYSTKNCSSLFLYYIFWLFIKTQFTRKRVLVRTPRSRSYAVNIRGWNPLNIFCNISVILDIKVRLNNFKHVFLICVTEQHYFDSLYSFMVCAQTSGFWYTESWYFRILNCACIKP